MVCVGEVLEEREGGKTEEVLVRQFRGGLGELTADQFAELVVAYEPIWAIGTGKTATPKIAADAHATIRKEAAKVFGRSGREVAADSVWRQREAGQCRDTNGAGRNQWSSGWRGESGSHLVCKDRELSPFRPFP